MKSARLSRSDGSSLAGGPAAALRERLQGRTDTGRSARGCGVFFAVAERSPGAHSLATLARVALGRWTASKEAAMGTMRRPKPFTILSVGMLTVLLALLVVSPSTVRVRGAAHREAPLISEDPAADIPAVSAFLNPNDPTQAVFALDVNPFAVTGLRSSYPFR